MLSILTLKKKTQNLPTNKPGPGLYFLQKAVSIYFDVLLWFVSVQFIFLGFSSDFFSYRKI